MVYLVKLIYAWILPPGGLITLMAILSLYMLFKKNKCAKLVGILTIIFYLLSIDLVGNELIKPLENKYTQPQKLNGDVIVMLGGGAVGGAPDVNGIGQVAGSPANRMLAVARLQKKTNLPIILSGGQVFSNTGREADIEKRVFMELGIPENKLFIENQSRNTVENARFTKKVCEKQGWKHPVLVTSGFHLPRSVMIFTREGMKVQPYPADYFISRPDVVDIFKFLPSNNALYNSCVACREYLGMLAKLYPLSRTF